VNVVSGATTTVNFTLEPNEQPNILLYAAAAIGIAVVLIGALVYLRKRKKTA
jgi:LPXTG-motif cell wall-anchored protein